MRPIFRWLSFVTLWGTVLCAQEAPAEPPPLQPVAESSFVQDVVPFLKKHCYDCHGLKEPESGLALEKYQKSSNVQTDYEVWEKVLRMLTERQMPPEDSPKPAEAELQKVIAALKAEQGRYDCSKDRHPGRVTIRRLNRPEYNNTVRDLVGLDLKLAAGFPSDDVGGGFDNIGDVLSLPPLLIEKYFAAAQTIVERVFEDEAARKKVMIHVPGEKLSEADALKRNIEDFGARAFRRPLTQDEAERFVKLAEQTRQAGGSTEEAFQGVMTAILVSPRFLFRVEKDPPPDDADRIRELDDYELASRLSYFLWSSMPDAELFRLAKAQKLHDPEVLKAQTRRMLGDPKAVALTKNFAGQWLQLRSVATVTPAAEQFPNFDPALRSAMRRETELFFEDVVQSDRSVLEFLKADYSFLNERLAKHYGITGIAGDDFRRVKLPAERRGVLTHASILLITSNPTRTSPVKRGKWILENILDEPPPPPPAGVQELSEDAETLGSLAGTHGAAPGQRILRGLPSQDGCAGLRAGELRRHRGLAGQRRPVRDRLLRNAPRRKRLPRCRRDGQDSGGSEARRLLPTAWPASC